MCALVASNVKVNKALIWMPFEPLGSGNYSCSSSCSHSIGCNDEVQVATLTSTEAEGSVNAFVKGESYLGFANTSPTWKVWVEWTPPPSPLQSWKQSGLHIINAFVCFLPPSSKWKSPEHKLSLGPSRLFTRQEKSRLGHHPQTFSDSLFQNQKETKFAELFKFCNEQTCMWPSP